MKLQIAESKPIMLIGIKDRTRNADEINECDWSMARSN